LAGEKILLRFSSDEQKEQFREKATSLGVNTR
jgi:hypothetical protein